MEEEVFVNYVKSKQVDLKFFYLAYKDMGGEKAYRSEEEFLKHFPIFFNSLPVDDKSRLIDNVMDFYNAKFQINIIFKGDFRDKNIIGYFK